MSGDLPLDAVAAEELTAILSGLQWSDVSQRKCLGDLSSFVHLLPAGAKRAGLRQLSNIDAFQNTARHTPIPSLSVYAVLRFPDETDATSMSVTSSQLALFYNSFFVPEVGMEQMTRFIHENVSLIIARKKFEGRSPTTFTLQVVGALTFARPHDKTPTYLAYLAVSDAKDKLPSLTDPKVQRAIGNSVASLITNGYQGFGLGTLLLHLLSQIVKSSFSNLQLPPLCLLHYNTNNADSGDGWHRHGFRPLYTESDATGIKQMRDQYQVLANGRADCLIFKACHDDQPNCVAMYLNFDYHAPCVPADWFHSFASTIDAKFRETTTPTDVYVLSSEEITAKYASRSGSLDRDPADLSFILDMAIARKDFRVVQEGLPSVPASTTRPRKAKAQRLPTHTEAQKWTNQDYLNFACIQDPNRTLDVDESSLRVSGSEQLLTVMVDGYILPDGVTLEEVRNEDATVTRARVSTECSWSWLQRELIPEVSRILDERLFGIPVVEGIGLNHPDPSVGKKDIASMASFLGVRHRAQDFMALPVSHKLIKLPLNDFIKGRKALTSPMVEHRASNKNFLKHVKSLSIRSDPPPLPRMPYQISRLKWIYTDDPTANEAQKYELGYFQGAYVVPETNFFTIVSLKDDWVVGEFDPTFLRKIKEHTVEGSVARRSRKVFVTIPPGAATTKTIPASSLIHYMRRCKYQQGSKTTCLMDAYCSAMFDFGCMTQVMKLRTAPGVGDINQTSSTFWMDFGNLVNRHFTPIGLRCFRQANNMSVNELLVMNDSFVIVATLKSTDGMVGQHAVAIFDGGIYDSNCRYVLKKTSESLDWCCGDGNEKCIGSARSYQMRPQGHKQLADDMRFIFQTRDDTGCNVRGWVKSVGEHMTVQLADGSIRKVSREELADFTRLN
jgi:hypothetical protein